MSETSLGEIFRFVDRLYRNAYQASSDVMGEVRVRTSMPWWCSEKIRWLDVKSYELRPDGYQLIPWTCTTWRHGDLSREIIIVQRFFSRVWALEPSLVIAVTPEPVRERKYSGWYLEEELRKRRVHPKVSPVYGDDRLVDLEYETGNTHPRFRAFSVSMDRLVDTTALKMRVVAPLVGLLQDDPASVLVSLDASDPARVSLVHGTGPESDDEQVS